MKFRSGVLHGDEVTELLNYANENDFALPAVNVVNTSSVNAVLQTAKDGKFQIWVLWDKSKATSVEKYFGVVVTELIKRKLGKVCHIYIMTGRQRHKWQYLVKDIEKFAKDEECQMMELIARPGWQKILNNYGYKRTHVVLEKKIKQEEKK